MGDHSGVGPINPHDKKMYEQEYRQGADLFQKALDHYSKSTNPNQQGEFRDVMDKSMQVLNETARELMRKELQKQNEQIANDYATFKKYPGDPDTIQQLKKDLDQAKKSIG